METFIRTINSKYFTLFLFLLILVLGALLRFLPYFSGDFYFLVDQARDMVLVQDIVINHDIPLIGARAGLGGIFHGPLWLFMVTPFFILSHGDPFWTLIPLFVLIHMGIILGIFLISIKLYDLKTALLASLFTTISFPLIHAVSYTTNAQVMPLVLVFYLYCIVLFLRGKDWYLIPSLFFIGVGFQFESAFAVQLLPLTVLIIILRFTRIKILTLILSSIAFVIPLSTFILFDLRHQFLMTKSAMKLIQGGVEPMKGYEQFSSVGFRFFDRLQGFTNSFQSVSFTSTPFLFTATICIVLFALFMILRFVYTKHKIKSTDREILVFLITPLLFFSIYILYPLPLWEHYTLPLAVPIVLAVSLCIRKLQRFQFGTVLVGGYLLISLFSPVQWVWEQYVTKHGVELLTDGSYRNQKAVAEWVYLDSKDKTPAYFVFTPQILTYNMDYLMWWIGESRYDTLPKIEKIDPTYLLMYPAGVSDQSAHTYWKKEVLHTVASGSAKLFKGDIVVEKITPLLEESSVDPNYFQNGIFR